MKYVSVATVLGFHLIYYNLKLIKLSPIKCFQDCLNQYLEF